MRGLLIAQGTPTTNPHPLNLATPNPFTVPYINDKTISAAWIAQGIKALFPYGARGREQNYPLEIGITPDNLAHSYVIEIWKWDSSNQVWIFLDRFDSSVQIRLITNPNTDPHYIYIKTLSAGYLRVMFDNGLAMAL